MQTQNLSIPRRDQTLATDILDSAQEDRFDHTSIT